MLFKFRGPIAYRCQVEALYMADDIVFTNADRCIGCGLCISVCPTSALCLEPLTRRPEIPAESREVSSLFGNPKA